MFSINQEKDGEFLISGNLTVNEADEFHSQLENHLESSTAVVLDLGKVTNMDTATLQILLSFKKAMDQGAGLVISNRSDRVTEIFAIYGLHHYFAN